MSEHINKKHKSRNTNSIDHTNTHQNNTNSSNTDSNIMTYRTNGHNVSVDHAITANPTNTHSTIDESLYSRQLYGMLLIWYDYYTDCCMYAVLWHYILTLNLNCLISLIIVFGREAQLLLQSSHILVVGINGVGVELCKNIILAGVGSVALYDNNVPLINELGSNFYLNESGINSKRTRAELCLPQLKSLNDYVHTYIIDDNEITLDILNKYNINCVVLCNQSLDYAIKLNHLVHNQIKLIYCNVHGLYGNIFVDNGESHKVVDIDGEQVKRGLISHISNATNGVVTCSDDSRHGLSSGDCVEFEEIQGMIELNHTTAHTINVISPYSFSIGDTTEYHPYTGNGGYFQQIKQPVIQSYKQLSDTIESPNIIDDWYGTSLSLHVLHLAIHQFYKQYNRYVIASNDHDIDIIKSMSEQIIQQYNYKSIDLNLIQRVARGSRSVISPMAAVIGGIAAQETLKSVTGKFNPIQQWYYYDCSSALPSNMLLSTEYHITTNTRYDDYINVFGHTVINNMRSSKYFIVGAGAIGCEMIKNFVLMGIGSMNHGSIIITDGDTIEKSNLNRQFLFRSNDVGQLKSVTAAHKAKLMNGDCNIQSHELRVDPSTEHTYNDEFYESLSGVCNALDNVEARLYMDSRCIYYQIPLIDSGTLGSKGSTQVIVPFITESYGSSRDPPDESIPICTLRNFPNKIEHTIQWARDMFEGLYKQTPDDVNAYIQNKTQYLDDLSRNPNIQVEKLRTITNTLLNRPSTYDDCILFARTQFDQEFNNSIQQLLYNFPIDHVTSDGLPFWSGPKRPPKPIRYDCNDILHIQYIQYTAQLYAYMFNLQPNTTDISVEHIKQISFTIHTKLFQPEIKRIAATDAEAKLIEQQAAAEMDTDKIVNDLLDKLNTISNFTPLQSITFEKDSITNGHIELISCIANLRARNYSIKESDRHTIKGIAGKIIPAIATTTALVTGLVCLELYKLQQSFPIEQYRNYSINLALPLIQSAEPIPPQYNTIQLKTGEYKWSLWDRIDIDVNKQLNHDCTLNAFIDYFTDTFGLDINMLSYGAALLYSNFTAPKKIKERLATPIVDLVQNIGKHELHEHEQYLILEPSVTDINTDQDVDIPYVRYKFR